MKKPIPVVNYALTIMRITMLQVLIAVGLSGLAIASPEHSYGQGILDNTLSISEGDKKLGDILARIEKLVHVKFSFNPKTIPVDEKVSVDLHEAKLKDVLADLLEPLGINYEVSGNYIILSKSMLTASADLNDTVNKVSIDGYAVTISGSVRSGTGELMPGVNIIQKGTTNGTTTDADGKYSLMVSGGDAVLVFSFIGYTMQEIAVNGRSVIDVVMAEDARSLEEVVVVGYGIQKKVSLTSAVSTVDTEELVARTTSNIQRSLQGIVPGLTIQDYGGSPRNANMVMRIRGITTLGTNNEPLVIVDGIEQRLTDINPQDIETISILKDASSTAIYGSRAANGVILINTKRAKAGKVSVSYNGFYAMQRSNNIPVSMGIEDYMRLENAGQMNSAGTLKYTEEYIQEYVAGTATDRIRYPLHYDWFNHILHDAPQVNHSLSVSGGNDVIRTLMSFRYMDQEGIIPNTDSKITEFRLNNDYKISKKINIGADFNYRRRNSMEPVSVGDVFTFSMIRDAYVVPKYPNGTYGISSNGHNALLYAELAGTSKSADNYLTGNMKGEWEILKGLKFSTQVGARMSTTKEKNYRNKYVMRDYYNPNVVTKQVNLNNLTEVRNEQTEVTINNLLNYVTTIGGHALNILGGYSQIKNESNNLSAFRQGFYNNDIQSMSQGANDASRTNTGNDAGWGLRSYFGRFNYSYQDKYLFEANSRYDGSSRFVGANRYSFFPSFSAGWRISQEKFWSGLNNVVNELKLRGSWGETGNQSVDLYSYYSALNLVNYSFSGAVAQGYLQSNMVNDDLTWETTTQTNIGLDVELLESKFSATVEYYHKKTDDILLVLPVPGALGLTPVAQNAGRMDNKGWEFAVRSRTMFGPVGFNVNLNFNINDNEVVNLASTGPYITGDSEITFITGEGYPYRSYWGYKSAGLFQTADEVAGYPTFLPNTKPGDVKYIDLNGDGLINANDKTFLGSTFPRYTFGSGFVLTYKNFTLNSLFQGAAGAKVQVGGSIDQMGNFGGNALEVYTNNYWTPENPNARFPRPTIGEVRNTQVRDNHIRNGAYLRLKNIQLVYQIPSSLTRKIGMEMINVYASGTDLVTISSLNEFNVDPETDGRRAENSYPQVAVYTLGVNVQF